MFLHAARRNVCSTFRNSNIRKFLRTFQEWHYARALHSRKHDHEVQLYAFDILALDGEDLRGLPLSMRKTNLARLLARHFGANSLIKLTGERFRRTGILVAPTGNS
jgi:ATP-dependent DNA ligase